MYIHLDKANQAQTANPSQISTTASTVIEFFIVEIQKCSVHMDSEIRTQKHNLKTYGVPNLQIHDVPRFQKLPQFIKKRK